MHPFLVVRPSLRGWPRVAVLLCLLAWLTLEGRSAHAQSAEPDYPAMALNWARSAAQQAADPSLSLRLEVSVGALDSRLKLAACGNVEAYLPPGARLWGRSRVGLRCIDGMSRWNVTVPVQVKALGRAWVVRSQVQAGAALAQNDVVSVEVDWAEDTSPVLLEPALWLGQTATRSLSTGQVLRQGLVRPTQVFQAGTQVRVLAEGPGFAVSSDAQALAPGVVGQMTRVRMENGRVTSGTVLDAHTVKIDI